MSCGIFARARRWPETTPEAIRGPAQSAGGMVDMAAKLADAAIEEPQFGRNSRGMSANAYVRPYPAG